jgi:serine/threonine-protein kinase
MPLANGAIFAGYTIVRLLGSGGMGEVYLVEHPRLPRQDALKVLRSDVSADDDFQRRFIREADLAANLWHPNIVRVSDRGEFDGRLWISMDYVDGTDATSLLHDRYPAGMRTDDVAAIISAVASALDYAHQRGLLHRDVKPANILLTNPSDGERRILLGDFGIARTTNDISGLTATNTALGTLHYAAPEQLMGEPMDGRADQYALAATAYHLLCGTTLFPLSNPAAVISRHLTSPPPTIAAKRPDLAAFDPVLARALAKDPRDRFDSCADFADALSAVAASQDQSATAHTMPALITRRQPASSIDTGSAAHLAPRRRLARWAIPIGVLVLVAAGVAVAAYRHQLLGMVAHPPPPAAVLDGTYKLSYDNQQTTLNGELAPPSSNSTSPPPPPGTEAAPNPSTPAPASATPPGGDNKTWWAFRSTCTSSGCVAAGTRLDGTNHVIADKSGATVELRFSDGQWVSAVRKDRVQYDNCLIEDGKDKKVPGSDTEATSWSWRPQPDGTLRGTWTNTVLTNECGFQGSVKQIPVTVTRTGDVPNGVAIADPAAVSVPPTPVAPAPGGPVLDGSYRVDFDDANQKINGVVSPPARPSTPAWWAFHSMCGSMGCVATAVELDANNNQVPTAVADVLHFVNGQWQSTPQDLLIPTCTVTRNGQTSPEQFPRNHMTRTWTPQPDGSLRGVETISVVTNECGQQGRVVEMPFVARQVGGVPAAAVLADPRLFIS